MIITCKKEIPFRWIAFAILPWASFTFNGYVVSVAFLFSLKKFVENPAALTFVLSLPAFISMFSQPLVSFLSDRIWTPVGRRKPFVATSLIGVALCLVAMPLMPNFWSLLAVFMLLSLFSDLNSPMEPLKQEIVPPHERGRATGGMTWCANLACMVFYFVALGRFDEVSYFYGLPLSGEASIYWSAGLMLIVMVLLVMLGIKEIDQKSALRGQRLSLANFFGGLLDPELWPVYMLVVGSACLNFYSGLGALSNLLYTDQWGYTKQEMGVNIAVGGIINMFAIGLLTVFADRLNRMRAYQTLICLSLLGNIAYYCYVNFVLPDKRPSLIEIIVFGETLSILSILTGLIYIPLVYDYVTRNKMGTYNAGATMVNRLTVLITLNGVGLFVWAYASLFQPPAGEMTRIVLRGGEQNKAEVVTLLRQASWTDPSNGLAIPASKITAQNWQATGAVANAGSCWEVRLRDKDSEQLAARRDKFEQENSTLVAQAKMLTDSAAIFKIKGNSAAAARDEQKAAAKQRDAAVSAAGMREIDAQLSARARNFHQEVLSALGDRLVADGDQIIGAGMTDALLVTLATVRRPDSHAIEQALEDIRRERSDLIDLRPLKSASGFGLVASAIGAPGQEETALGRSLQAAVKLAVEKYDPGLFPAKEAPPVLDHDPALKMDLMVVEEPLDTYISPITRLVDFFLGFFHRVPPADRRLAAISRTLRIVDDTNHVRVNPGPSPRTISVTAVLSPSAVKPLPATDPVARKLRLLLGPAGAGEFVARATSLYGRIEAAAATERLTLVRPTLASAYAPIKYDYMSGYLWMFIMGLGGIGITIAFVRLEAKGFVQKRGVEEAAIS
jgi:Na+/melibiose symporter-like transporter